jgi:Uma2 family endonuclease
MAPAISTRLTYEDYLLLPDDGKRHEIIDGEHYVTPSPAKKHQVIAGNLHALIWSYTRRVRTGTVLVAPFDVILSDEDILQPDVLFIAAERSAIATERGVRGAPDLVIEVLSDGTRKIDQTLKLKRYDHFGVQEYWMVDPRTETVAIYRRTAAGLELAATDDPITSPLLPGFTLPLHDIFAE